MISEAEANLFKPTGVAQQGALTHFFTWEVNKYTEYGPDDPMAEGMPIFAPLQSWGVQLEAPSSIAFDMGKFAFWSDALEERDSNWIEQHRVQAAQLPPGDQRDYVLRVGRVSRVGGRPMAVVGGEEEGATSRLEARVCNFRTPFRCHLDRGPCSTGCVNRTGTCWMVLWMGGDLPSIS